MSEPIFVPISQTPGLTNDEIERWAVGFEEALTRFLEERAGGVPPFEWDEAKAWWSVKAELADDEWEVELALPSGFSGVYLVTPAGSELLEGRADG